MRAPVNRRVRDQLLVCNRWIPPDLEWLRDQYLVQKKSSLRIADELGVDASTVRKWLRRVGIPCRNLREASALRSTHLANRPPAGARSPNWGGDSVGESAFRYRGRVALQQSGIAKKCEWCSGQARIQVNHRDHDCSNNDLSNLQYLCSRCHRLETLLWNMYEEGKIDLPVRDDKIVLQEDEVTIVFLQLSVPEVKVGTKLGELT